MQKKEDNNNAFNTFAWLIYKEVEDYINLNITDFNNCVQLSNLKEIYQQNTKTRCDKKE